MYLCFGFDTVITNTEISDKTLQPLPVLPPHKDVYESMITLINNCTVQLECIQIVRVLK